MSWQLPVLFLYKLIFAMCASQNVTAHHIAPPIFVYIKYVLLPTTLYFSNIEPKIYSTHFLPWRRYTFLSHLTTKSKISVRWIKKLVAATYGVCQFLQSTSNFITKRPTNNKKGAISAFLYFSYLFVFGVLIDLSSSISTASLKTSLTVGWA